MIEEKTCFKFVEKKDEHTDYLMFEPSGSCFSYVGRIGKKFVVCAKDFSRFQAESKLFRFLAGARIRLRQSTTLFMR
jgi:hypothetical protein